VGRVALALATKVKGLHRVVGLKSRLLKSSSEEGAYLRLVDVCLTQLYAESNKEEEEKFRSLVQIQRVPEEVGQGEILL
jgi:hypothetical protein